MICRHLSVMAAVALCAGTLAAAQAIPAQTIPTQRSIQAQLHGPLLMLRGMYDGGNLKFDAEGNLIGTAATLPFGLSAVRIDKVKVSGSEVELIITREGLVIADRVKPTGAYVDVKTGKLAGSLPTWEHAPQPVSAEAWGKHDRAEIDIALDRQHPEEMTEALKKVFSVGFDQELTDAAPEAWRAWLRHEMDPKAEIEPLAQGQKPKCTEPMAGCPGVKAPKLLHSAEARFSDAARRRKYSGICVMGVIVDRNGLPQDVHIVRAVGMGLDEEAVEAVSQYRFKPAQYQGKPVPVYIYVEVNFHIY